jgi:hypothetical protein
VASATLSSVAVIPDLVDPSIVKLNVTVAFPKPA